MRILVADDLKRVRSAIRLMLETLPGAEIVAEAVEAGEVPDLIAARGPDCLLLDWELPGLTLMGGLPLGFERSVASTRICDWSSSASTPRPSTRLWAAAPTPSSARPSRPSG